MKPIEAIIGSLRVAMTDARQNESHFESWMILNEAICVAIDALAKQPAEQQEPVSDRENSIIRFALHQFMSNAYAHLTAAAQDKEGKRYPSEAVEKFAKDAEDAQALLKRLQFTSPPASKPWVGLTDEEVDECYYWKDRLWTTDELVRHVQAKLREKNELV